MAAPCRAAIIVVAAVLFQSVDAHAEIPLKDLDQSAIRKAAGEVLARPNVKDRLNAYNTIIQLNENQIVYIKANKGDDLPTVFEWRYRALSKLDAQQTARLKTVLTEVIANALGNVGRLLADSDAVRVLAKFDARPAEPDLAAKDVPQAKTGVRSILVSGVGSYSFGYWPGPVLPGMWGGVYGGLWPDGWWLGGPYLYSGWDGSWGNGSGHGSFHSCCLSGGGAWPVILPPVFGPVAYPAVSPYWVPRVAPFWVVPAAAWPVVIAKNDPLKKPAREYRPVPTSANAERLYADALWLFWEDNFESAREHLAAAILLSPRDARLWYYRALSERALGDDRAANHSAENGAALQVTGATDKCQILAALERIQGPDRKYLEAFVSGPKAISFGSAMEIVNRLTPNQVTAGINR